MLKPICVILLNWNTPRHTLRCIDSIMGSCDRSLYDIVVADNGSTDNSLDQFKSKYPELIYIDNEENLGFAEGNNRALRYSIENGYKYSILLNSDTEVQEELLRPLLHYMEKNAHVGAIQPAIYCLEEPKKIWNGGSYFNPIIGLTYTKKGIFQPTEVDWITGCAMMMRNSILKKTGLFNKNFFLYYEDVDLSFRIRKAGFTLFYYPEVKLYHEAGVSGKLPSKEREGVISPIVHYYNTRNKIWILRKYGNFFFAPTITLYTAGYNFAVLIYFILRGRTQKAKSLLRGLKDGLLTSPKDIWN